MVMAATRLTRSIKILSIGRKISYTLEKKQMHHGGRRSLFRKTGH